MKSPAKYITLTPLEDLFATDESRAEAKKPKVEQIPIDELTEFPNHPFKTAEGEELEQMIESIKNSGVITPAIVRPKEDGYELISGHRRFAAAKAAGLESIPAIIRDMSDDEAVVAMVDANLQREYIPFSEKAFAYKMKMEAVSRQGNRNDLTCGQVGHKSRDTISNEESGRQIQRYIRLTYLNPKLLKMVDEKKIAFSPAVELSYLKKNEQRDLLSAIQREDCTPSLSQAQKLKKLSQSGSLNTDIINEIMSETKANQKEKISFDFDEIRKFFPKSYTPAQIRDNIIKLLDKEHKRTMHRDYER